MNAFRSLSSLYSHPYNRRHPLGALYRVGRWHARKRSARPWVAPVWNGRRAIFWPDSAESRWLAYNHVMDWREFVFMQRYLRADSVMVDVGANIGVYTLWASAWIGSGGRIVAFEPDPTNYARLREQVDVNGLTWVKAEPIGVAASIGTARLVQGKDVENHLASAEDLATSSCETRTIDTTTLDVYAAAHQIATIDYLKIDVEGAELEVFRGSEALLQRGAVTVIQFEANELLRKFGLTRDDVFGFLKRFDYDIYDFDPSHNRLSRIDTTVSPHQNLFAIRDLNAVLQRVNR